MDLNKYLNNAAPSEPQYSKEEYAAMKKTEREAVWVQVDARMGEVLADASTLQGFLDFMSQCRNSLPNQLLLSGQNADITDAILVGEEFSCLEFDMNRDTISWIWRKNRIQEVAYRTLTEENLSKRHQLYAGR